MPGAVSTSVLGSPKQGLARVRRQSPSAVPPGSPAVPSESRLGLLLFPDLENHAFRIGSGHWIRSRSTQLQLH